MRPPLVQIHRIPGEKWQAIMTRQPSEGTKLKQRKLKMREKEPWGNGGPP